MVNLEEVLEDCEALILIEIRGGFARPLEPQIAHRSQREFFELKACDVIMYDVTWCGGPSEAKRISGI